VCEACVTKFKAKLSAKLLEKPEMREQIDKELRDIQKNTKPDTKTIHKATHKKIQFGDELWKSLRGANRKSFILSIYSPSTLLFSLLFSFFFFDRKINIDDWVSLAPTLRIKKRSDGKSGSESSPSSSSSDSSSLKSPRGTGKNRTALFELPQLHPQM
jgi:hypothetical protein